jgi:hypothetical protein
MTVFVTNTLLYMALGILRRYAIPMSEWTFTALQILVTSSANLYIQYGMRDRTPSTQGV